MFNTAHSMNNFVLAVCLNTIIRNSKIKIPSIAYSPVNLDVNTIGIEFVHLMYKIPKRIQLGVRPHFS